jgi:hypothetical protein
MARRSAGWAYAGSCAQIADLKRELSMHDALASRSRVLYEPYSDVQRVSLMEELQKYLAADEAASAPMPIESVRQSTWRVPCQTLSQWA